jgi:hypothetical protein
VGVGTSISVSDPNLDWILIQSGQRQLSSIVSESGRGSRRAKIEKVKKLYVFKCRKFSFEG